MNSSLLLPIFNTTLGLSSRINDFMSVYVFTFILMSGILFNSISIFVLSKILKEDKKKRTTSKMNIFKYMLLNVIADFCACLIGLPMALFRCGNYCSIGYDYYSKVYEAYIFVYLGNTVLFWGFLVEISFAIERLTSFSSSKTKQNRNPNNETVSKSNNVKMK